MTDEGACDLQGFLDWLEEHRKGERDPYRELLERLVAFFIGRNQNDPEECAAATLHIAALGYRPSMRKDCGHPRMFVFGVARNVNLSSFRAARRFTPLDEKIQAAQPPPVDEEAESELVQECIREFGRRKVDGILSYYDEWRKGKAFDGATRTRICRWKAEMKAWLEERVARRPQPNVTLGPIADIRDRNA